MLQLAGAVSASRHLVRHGTMANRSSATAETPATTCGHFRLVQTLGGGGSGSPPPCRAIIAMTTVRPARQKSYKARPGTAVGRRSAGDQMIFRDPLASLTWRPRDQLETTARLHHPARPRRSSRERKAMMLRRCLT